jgi:hypothetical protein
MSALFSVRVPGSSDDMMPLRLRDTNAAVRENIVAITLS